MTILADAEQRAGGYLTEGYGTGRDVLGSGYADMLESLQGGLRRGAGAADGRARRRRHRTARRRDIGARLDHRRARRGARLRPTGDRPDAGRLRLGDDEFRQHDAWGLGSLRPADQQGEHRLRHAQQCVGLGWCCGHRCSSGSIQSRSWLSVASRAGDRRGAARGQQDRRALRGQHHRRRHATRQQSRQSRIRQLDQEPPALPGRGAAGDGRQGRHRAEHGDRHGGPQTARSGR